MGQLPTVAFALVLQRRRLNSQDTQVHVPAVIRTPSRP